jgi:hypothetical protein
MIGWWYVAFICIGVAAIALVITANIKLKYRKWSKIYDDTGRQYDLDLREEAREKKFYYFNADVGPLAVLAISGGLGLIFTLMSIFMPISCKWDVAYFKEQKAYVESAVANGTDLENIAITQTIIDANTFLAEAKADLRTWGVFSGYTGTDLEELTPIMIQR